MMTACYSDHVYTHRLQTHWCTEWKKLHLEKNTGFHSDPCFTSWWSEGRGGHYSHQAFSWGSNLQCLGWEGCKPCPMRHLSRFRWGPQEQHQIISSTKEIQDGYHQQLTGTPKGEEDTSTGLGCMCVGESCSVLAKHSPNAAMIPHPLVEADLWVIMCARLCLPWLLL